MVVKSIERWIMDALYVRKMKKFFFANHIAQIIHAIVAFLTEI